MGGSCHCEDNIGFARSCENNFHGNWVTDGTMTFTTLSLELTARQTRFGVRLLRESTKSFSVHFIFSHQSLRTTETPLQHSCGFHEVLRPTLFNRPRTAGLSFGHEEAFVNMHHLRKMNRALSGNPEESPFKLVISVLRGK